MSRTPHGKDQAHSSLLHLPAGAAHIAPTDGATSLDRLVRFLLRGYRLARISRKAIRKASMAANRGVVYVGPGTVEVRSIDYPKLLNPQNRTANHGVILKVLTTNICGSDQHMVRGRTTAPEGLVLGHEITGEVIEAG
jgi:hypothetical protein